MVGWVWWRHQTGSFLVLPQAPPTLNPPLPKSAKWCHEKLLDPAENLVTIFQLKSAKISEMLLKNLPFLRCSKYACKVMYQFLVLRSLSMNQTLLASAVSAQLCPPQIVYRGPLMVIYKISFRRFDTSRGQIAFKKKAESSSKPELQTQFWQNQARSQVLRFGGKIHF